MARKIESLFLDGPAGRLEALLEEPDEVAKGVALVCHPHPNYGGTMHNKVVYRLARGLRRSGHVVLRFNYRGVNLSAGSYAHGEGEREDARVAIGFLNNRYQGLPLTLAGFSFGSRIALTLGCETDPSAGARIRRVIAVGFPTEYKNRTFLDHCTTQRIFVQSTHDQYGSVEELESMYQALPEPKELFLVDAQDHFFAGALEKLEETIFLLG
jgi:uncharacterized protein